MQLEESLFKDQTEEFICKVASTVEEVKVLIEAGFKYICDFNGAKMFRKRKRKSGQGESVVGRERFELIKAWRYPPANPYFLFYAEIVLFLSIVRKTIERFYFVEFLCEFVRASRIQMYTYAMGFFFKRSSMLGFFT